MYKFKWRLYFWLYFNQIVSAVIHNVLYTYICLRVRIQFNLNTPFVVFNLENLHLRVWVFIVYRSKLFIFVISTCFYRTRSRAGVFPCSSTITPEVDRWAVRLVVFRSNSRRNKCLSTKINIADVNTSEVHSSGASKNFIT